MKSPSSSADKKTKVPRQAVDFGMLAFSDARAEILERVRIREKLSELYIVVSVGLIAALSAMFPGKGTAPAELFLLPAILALAISYRLRSHVNTTEAIAEFIRRELNAFLITEDAWAPYWDWSTHADSRINDRPPFSNIIKSRRLLSDTMSLHFPCAISMAYYFFYTKMNSAPASIWNVSLFLVGCTMFLWALENTWGSYRNRERTKVNRALSSDAWKDMRVAALARQRPEDHPTTTHPDKDPQ